MPLCTGRRCASRIADGWICTQVNKYMRLDQKGNIMAEYVWIDANSEVRSKSRVSCRASTCVAHEDEEKT